MAKLDVKVVLRLVKAFGAGVQAEEVEKVAALTEAYALIDQHLQSQIPSIDPIKEAVEAHDGNNVTVVTSEVDSWRGEQGKLALIEFLARNIDELVLIEQGGGQITGHVGSHDEDDSRIWFVVTGDTAVQAVDFDTIRFARKLACGV